MTSEDSTRSDPGCPPRSPVWVLRCGRRVAPSVRPTLRALRDLGLGFPRLDQALDPFDQPLIRKAQDLPEEVLGGGAERVLSLTDRVWFTVKTHDERGAAGDLNSPDA